MLQTVDAAVIQQWEEATAAAVLAAITAACGSSFFLSSAADVVSAADADATANHVLNLRNNKDGVNHSVLLIAFLYSSI